MRRTALAALTLAATAGIPAGTSGTAARAQGMGNAAGPVTLDGAEVASTGNGDDLVLSQGVRLQKESSLRAKGRVRSNEIGG